MKKWIILSAFLMAGISAFAEDAAVQPPVVTEETAAPAVAAPVIEAPAVAVPEVTPSEPAPAPKELTFVVLLPERIDHDWYWILYTDVSQHIVQSAIEKALIRAGLNVVDLSTITLPSVGSDMQQIMSINYAVEAGRIAKADYVITGQATAVKASEGFAYGVNVYRSQAEISAKIVRVSDGRILEVEDASQLEGGQSAQAAGQSALKKASVEIGSKMARAARALASADKPAP